MKHRRERQWEVNRERQQRVFACLLHVPTCISEEVIMHNHAEVIMHNHTSRSGTNSISIQCGPGYIHVLHI